MREVARRWGYDGSGPFVEADALVDERVGSANIRVPPEVWVEAAKTFGQGMLGAALEVEAAAIATTRARHS